MENNLISPLSNPTQALEKLWKNLTTKQKKSLLKARNLNTSFAKTKTIKEMVNRGGGMVASNLLELVREHGRRNPTLMYKY